VYQSLHRSFSGKSDLLLIRTEDLHRQALPVFKMSFLFGGGRPQPTSEQKIAAAENEVEMVSDMFQRYGRDSCLD
jgi:hypothetical protein